MFICEWIPVFTSYFDIFTLITPFSESSSVLPHLAKMFWPIGPKCKVQQACKIDIFFPGGFRHTEPDRPNFSRPARLDGFSAHQSSSGNIYKLSSGQHIFANTGKETSKTSFT